MEDYQPRTDARLAFGETVCDSCGEINAADTYTCECGGLL